MSMGIAHGRTLCVPVDWLAIGVALRSRAGTTGTADMKSCIFDERSRGDMEKQDTSGSCLGSHPYAGGIVDRRDDSESLGGLATDEPVLAAAVPTRRVGSWYPDRRTCCVALAMRATLSAAATWAEAPTAAASFFSTSLL